MKKLTTAIAAVLFAATFAACSDNPTSPGGSTSGTYMPVTKNSSWTYNGRMSYTLTIMGDTTIGGKTYTLANNSSAGMGLMRKESNSIFSSTLSDPTSETLVLKENVPVGTKWSFDLTVNGTPNHYDMELAETGLTRTVNDSTYKDVVRIHLKNSMTFMGQTIPVQEADYYYAKGIGLVESDLGIQGKINLVSYTVK